MPSNAGTYIATNGHGRALQNLSSTLDPRLDISISRQETKINPLSSYMNCLYALQAMSREDASTSFWTRRFSYPGFNDVLLGIESSTGGSWEGVTYRLALDALYETIRQMAVNAWFVDLSAFVSYDGRPAANIRFVGRGPRNQGVANVTASGPGNDTQQSDAGIVFNRRHYNSPDFDVDGDEPPLQDISSTNVALNASDRSVSDPPLGLNKVYPTPRIKMKFAQSFVALALGIAHYAFQDPNRAIEPVTLSPTGIASELKVGSFERGQRLSFTNRDAIRMLWFAAKAMVDAKSTQAVSYRVSKKADASQRYWYRVGWINLTAIDGDNAGIDQVIAI